MHSDNQDEFTQIVAVHSDAGRDCRDVFLGLAKTCTKLGIAFWDNLGSRIGGCGSPAIPPLAERIRCRGQPPDRAPQGVLPRLREWGAGTYAAFRSVVCTAKANRASVLDVLRFVLAAKLPVEPLTEVGEQLPSQSWTNIK